MTEQRLDTLQVRRAFARAASTYERHDALQREVESRLFDSLDYYDGKPQRVLDIGCGTGRGTALLKKRWRDAEVVALDLSMSMLREARRNRGWLRPFERVCADGQALPFPDRSMDVVYSNLCLQWCDSPRPLLAECARVLKPGGFMVASSLGSDTLTLARRHPRARFVLAHAGITDLAWIRRELDDVPNLFFDTSWWNVADLRALFANVPPGHLLYGSDAPYGGWEMRDA